MHVFCEGIELGNNGSDSGMISGTYERNGKNRKARLNRKYDDAEGRVGNLRHNANVTHQFLELYTIQQLCTWLTEDAPNFFSLLTVLVSRVQMSFGASANRDDMDGEGDDDEVEEIADKEMV